MKALKMRRSARQSLSGFLLVLPAVILIFGMMLYPMIWSVRISLSSNSSVLSGNYQFVGLDNYAKMFSNAKMWSSVQNTVTYVIVTVALELILGLMMASQMNRRLPGTKMLRALTATPMMVASIASGLIWKLIFYDNNGVMNWFLNQLGFESIGWFANQSGARVAVLLASLWGSLPFAVLTLLAAMQGIPEEYLEAAVIDGASGWQHFIHITLPLLRSTILMILIIRVSDAYKIYDIIVSLTNAGPANATNSISFYIYRRTYFDMKFGEGTAVSFILLGVIIISCLLVLGMFYITGRERKNGLG